MAPTSRNRVRVNAVTPFLWFKEHAARAAQFYTSLIQDSKVTRIVRANARSPESVVTFTLAGQSFIALNGGPVYKLTPAFSVQVSCPTQKVVDELWRELTRGGKESRCGWLVDRYGLSWQIIPERLPELLGDPDPERARRAFDAMMTMQKIDVAALESAVEGS